MTNRAPPLEHTYAQIMCLICILVIFYPGAIYAQVWSCAEGYTNLPEGKTNCQRAGASQVCSGGGERFFAPSKGESQNIVASCERGAHTNIKTAGASALSEAQALGDSLFNRVSNSMKSAKEAYFPRSQPSTRMNKKIIVGESEYEDIFSCFAGGEGNSGCSIAQLSDFVENTFAKAGEALK